METRNTQAMLNGDIDRFLEAALAARITGADTGADSMQAAKPASAAS